MTDNQTHLKLPEIRKCHPESFLPMTQTMLYIMEARLCFPLSTQKDDNNQISFLSVGRVTTKM